MKILIPCDGTALALKAVHHALRLVREGLDAELVLANVQEPSSLYEVMTLHDPAALEQVNDMAGHDMLAAAVALAREAGVAYAEEVATGDPESVLLEIQERTGCDLIVMGCHDKGWIGGSFTGSVSQAVLERSTVPVTLVRETELTADMESAEWPEGPGSDPAGQ